MKLYGWAASDSGRKRDHNEDSFLVEPELGLFAVADGMGGHQGGGHASRLALEVMRREVAAAGGDYGAAAMRLGGRGGRTTLPFVAGSITADLPADEVEGPAVATAARGGDTGPAPALVIEPRVAASLLMRDAARKAGLAVYDAAQNDAKLRGMGTTLTAMLYAAGRMHIVHAGDSRAYLFRDGAIKQITEDHSWIAEQVRSGQLTEAEARGSKFRHIITRSVGFEQSVLVDAGDVEARPGDCFLLCSDGMSNYIENGELERILETSWYRRAPDLLVDIANDRGGDDNITVVVVYVANEGT
jgi:protein phosphatase